MQYKISTNNIITVKVKIVERDDLFLNILITQFHSVKFIYMLAEQYWASCHVNTQIHQYTDTTQLIDI
jgi:hypothetical protein